MHATFKMMSKQEEIECDVRNIIASHKTTPILCCCYFSKRGYFPVQMGFQVFNIFNS